MLELIPKDISEFKTIVLDLTNRCNLKCPLCFRTNTKIDSLYDQDFKHVKQLLKKQISNKTNTILLANIYAEPLLYKYIDDSGNDSGDYASSLDITGSLDNKVAKTVKYKVYVKASTNLKTVVNYDINYDVVQKKMD